MESHAIISDIRNNPMSLGDLRRETLRINGLIRAILSNVDETSIPSQDFGPLRSKMRRYLDEYDFEGEMLAMGPLYSEDAQRVENMRIKILEALRDRRMMEAASYIVDDL